MKAHALVATDNQRKQSKHICRGEMFLWLGKVWILSWLYHFRTFFWRGLQCHRLGDCCADLSKIRSQKSIPVTSKMIAKNTWRIFWNLTEKLVYSLPHKKFPKCTCVVAFLHNGAAIELSVEGRTSRATNKSLCCFHSFACRYHDLKLELSVSSSWNLCSWQL